jgi:hypothetical protein
MLLLKELIEIILVMFLPKKFANSKEKMDIENYHQKILFL